MDIIKFALKMELDGKAFYEKHAAKTDDPDLKKILEMLAEEEDRHFKFFQKLKDNPTDLTAGDILAGSTTLKEVQNVFEVMSQNDDKEAYGNDVISVWTEALRTEEKAVQLYTEQAEKESNPGRRALLERIADEERTHVQMIDGVLFYIKHPQGFADSAQFKNFRSLEGF